MYEGGGHWQAVGDDGGPQGDGECCNYLKDGAPAIHNYQLALLQEPSRRLSNRSLAQIGGAHTLLKGQCWRARKGAAVYTLECSRLGELIEIASYRIFGDLQTGDQVGGQHFALLP